MALKFYVNKSINMPPKSNSTSLVKRTIRFCNRKVNQICPSIQAATNQDTIIVSYFDRINNFGDKLNPYLIQKISDKKVYNYTNVINISNKPVYSVIGSILDNKNIKNLEIWGSGFISKNGKFIIPPKKIHAVRGPLSRELILKQGIPCPENYGDPALLLPFFYNVKTKYKKYKVGIVPHYVDKDNIFIDKFKKRYEDDVVIIDVKDNLFNVIEIINQCEIIASSSLHGIIIADTYNIPSLWIKLSNNLYGGDFKFLDYLLSVKKKNLTPLIVSKELTIDQLYKNVACEKINIDKLLFYESCPFKKDNL